MVVCELQKEVLRLIQSKCKRRQQPLRQPVNFFVICGPGGFESRASLGKHARREASRGIAGTYNKEAREIGVIWGYMIHISSNN